MVDTTTENLQDISAIGGLDDADLFYGFRTGEADPDFNFAALDLKDLVANGKTVAVVNASNVTSVEFVNGQNGVVFDGTYRRYGLFGYDYYRNSGTGALRMETTLNGGVSPTWDTVGTLYRTMFDGLTSTGANTNWSSQSSTNLIPISAVIGTVSTDKSCFFLEFSDPTAGYMSFLGASIGWNGSTLYSTTGGGYRMSASTVEGFRIRCGAGTGNFSGKFVLKGYK